MPKNTKGKICILACVFWPIYPGFGGRHAYVIAENLVKAGYDVHIITTFPIDLNRKRNFFRQKLLSREDVSGMKIYRVPSFLPTGGGLRQKFAFYISFMLTSVISLPFVRGSNFILGLHPPAPFLIFPSVVFSRLLRAKYILRVTDLWPDVVFDFDLAKSNFVRKTVIMVSKTAYRLADHIMAFTPQIEERIKAYGVSGKKISMVEMAVDTDLFRPAPEPLTEAQGSRLPNPKDKFVVLYSGAFALTYDFDLLLEAAKKLEDQNILFVLLGDGDAKSEILRKIENLRLDNVFLPTPVSRPEEVARFINYSDVCVIPLKPQMITSTLTRPSKVFEFWACGKPVVCCTKGELKDLIEQSGAGIVLEPGDLEAFTQAIKSLSSDPGRTSEMGEKARDFVLQRFSYERLRWKLGQMFDRLSLNTK